MNAPAVVHIAYGKGRIPLVLDPDLAEWHVIAPRSEAALAEAHEAFVRACRNPIGTRPLREVVKANDRVVIVTSDNTRPVPNRLLIPWILEEIPTPPENVTVLVGTGTHRANTEDELAAMFGEELCRKVRVVNHDAFEPQRNTGVGATPAGAPIMLSQEYVHADKRIAVGFIEPHFFAGFSGGAKAIVPGIAGIETILDIHRYDLIAAPRSTWGILNGNPLHEAIVERVSACPPDFLVNVTLDNEKAITRLFLGDYMEAHRVGCEHVRKHAMAQVPYEFPVVITSNSGYPLDQNLYQSVKGMSAAARIVEKGGMIFMASECSDGIPEHGSFGAMLQRHERVEDVQAWLEGLDTPVLDQWQVQVLAQILNRCRVNLYSTLDPAVVRACKMSPMTRFEESVREYILSIGNGARVAVLPEGPLTIPYVA